MTQEEKLEWLRDLYALLSRNPDAELSYNTSDDGVWLNFGPERRDFINLGFSHDSARTALFEHLQKSAEK